MRDVESGTHHCSEQLHCIWPRAHAELYLVDFERLPNELQRSRNLCERDVPMEKFAIGLEFFENIFVLSLTISARSSHLEVLSKRNTGQDS